jgi:hypothetical protein
MKTPEEMFHYINRLSIHDEHFDEYDLKREIKGLETWANSLAQTQLDELRKEIFKLTEDKKLWVGLFESAQGKVRESSDFICDIAKLFEDD